MRLEDQVVQARTHRVVSEVVGDELVVYDLDTDEAHLLSPNVARVWQAAHGGSSVASLLAEVAVEHPEQAGYVVWAAVEQLQAKRLLDGSLLLPSESTGISRRTLLKRIGLAAVAIPVITTIVAPSPAAAACSPTTGGFGQPCCSAGACQPSAPGAQCQPASAAPAVANLCCIPGSTTAPGANSPTCPPNGGAPAPGCCSGACGTTSNTKNNCA